MTPNRQKRSDVTAGVIFIALAAAAIVYFTPGAVARASGAGPEPSGSLIPLMFTVALPAAAAYLTWMLVHRYLDAPPANAVLVALFVSFFVGFFIFRSAVSTSAWASVAVASAVMLLLCATVVIVEVRLARRQVATVRPIVSGD